MTEGMIENRDEPQDGGEPQDAGKKAAGAARRALIERIFDCSLELTLTRLEEVDHKDRKDSLAFDRIARTAHVLLRVAHEARALNPPRKENAADDKGAPLRLPDDQDIDRIENALDRAAARCPRGPQRGDPQTRAGREPGAAAGADAGGRA